MRAMVTAMKELTADPKLYRKQLVERFKVAPALAEAMPVGLNLVDPVAHAKDFQVMIDALSRNHLITKPLPAAEIIAQVKP
jgi:hypothetical protein